MMHIEFTGFYTYLKAVIEPTVKQWAHEHDYQIDCTMHTGFSSQQAYYEVHFPSEEVFTHFVMCNPVPAKYKVIP